MKTNKYFLLYLLISVVGHIVIAFSFYFVAMFGLFAGLGNASSSTFTKISYIFLTLFVVLVGLQIFLLTRKSLSLLKRIVVAFFPLVLGVIVFISINPIGEKVRISQESNAVSKLAKSIRFQNTFTIENFENNRFSHHTIRVPFKSDKEFSLNGFLSAYSLEIEGQSLNNKGNDLSGCPLNSSNVFDSILDSKGKMYKDVIYYGDGEKLPASEYVAINYFSINVAEDKQKECYEKVLQRLKNTRKINIYYTDIFKKSSKEFISQLRLSGE